MIDTKHRLEFLEVMITSACNLSCHGCTTFSDLRHQGYVAWSQAQEWLQLWKPRLDLSAIGIIGGEPLMNPDIRNYITGIRNLFPDTQIRFVTNGLLLHKHFDIVNLLDSVGNAVLKISYHVHDEQLDNTIQKILAYAQWQPIHEFGIDRLVSASGMRFQIAKPETFLKTFRNDYQNMMPHDSQPAEAFEICVQKRCPMLLDGKIWKCGTLALTPRILQRMGNPNLDAWQPYLQAGLDSSCSDSDLEKFVANFGKPHVKCAQCPSSKDTQSMFDHRSTVRFKNKTQDTKTINYGVDSDSNL